MIDKLKINKIVEYIQQFRFEFEVIEVEEGLLDILGYYELGNLDLTSEEHELLVQELTPLAEEFEFNEAAHLAFQEEEMIIV